MEVGCVYLARKAEGLQPIQEFLESYTTHSAGLPHTLIVIFKGWSAEDINTAKEIFAKTEHLTLEISDDGYDIGAYLKAARQFETDYMCFFNTFSQIQAENWLLKLFNAVMTPGVGMAGATGSYESPYSTAVYFDSIIYDFRYGGDKERQKIGVWAEGLFQDRVDFKKPANFRRALAANYRRAVRRLLNISGLSTREKYIERATGSKGRHGWTRRFIEFPNIHLRSNAFIINRTLFNSLDLSSPQTKDEAIEFECGRDGLSAKLLRLGYQLRLVGKDGTNFEVKNWPEAGAYRSRGQINLLVSDNQTRAYDRMPDSAKLIFQRFTWGTAMPDKLPSDFPDYSVDFYTNL